MALNSDLKEFVELLNSHIVEYLVVGAHALAFYGHPRFTGDLDLLIRRSEQNAGRMMRTLHEFGFDSMEVTKEDFLVENQIVQLGRIPHRIDILTGMTGLSDEEAWSDPVEGLLDGIPVRFISRDAFIQSKLAIGRPRDLADVEILRGQQ